MFWGVVIRVFWKIESKLNLYDDTTVASQFAKLFSFFTSVVYVRGWENASITQLCSRSARTSFLWFLRSFFIFSRSSFFGF
jgi:hypothetical protein